MWVDENSFEAGENIDYTTLLSGQERDAAIEDLRKSDWFGRLFSPGKEPDTIVYNGGIETVKGEWYEKLRQELQAFIESGRSDTHRLKKAIDQPIAGHDLFCFPGWLGNGTYRPSVLLEFLETIKPGTVLYINSVLDYHW